MALSLRHSNNEYNKWTYLRLSKNLLEFPVNGIGILVQLFEVKTRPRKVICLRDLLKIVLSSKV